MRALVRNNFDPTYLTVAGGINFSGDGAWSDQILEADLNQHFHWWNNPPWLKETLGIDGFMAITAKIRLRMLSGPSEPVKTPSFMPRITYYWWRAGEASSLTSASYYSLMLSHHSNGQDGPFYNPDGSINTDTGSFSTNYFELSRYQLTQIAFLPHWSQLSLIWHAGFAREPKLAGQYEKVKIKLHTRTREYMFGDWGLINSSLLSYTLKGRDYIVAPDPGLPAILPIRARRTDNIHVATEFHIAPAGWNDMRIFIKYDFGYDYYNIHFRERINRVQIGVSGATSI
jgi:hypothetical protein